MIAKRGILGAALILLLVATPTVFGQIVSSRVTGTVADTTGAVIPGATVQLKALLTQATRTTTTAANGRFLFTNVLAGGYDLHIEVSGFNAYDQRGLTVAAQETVALGTIRMTIGEVTTSIEVAADVARVQTESSDRSETIDTTTIGNLPLIGRDYRGILNTLPGNIQTGQRDAPGWGGGGIPQINGGNIGAFLVTLDGIASQDSGWTASQYIAPNVDSIGEVKVMVSNYNAEYGARSAGQMNVTFKNGTPDFHGTLYHYWRHESLNANEWFNNARNTPKARYRYQNPGGTIGGPVLIPGTRFNESRTKLFFFYSEEHLYYKNIAATDRINMPTALERAGDFSRSLTEDGMSLATIIRDPTTGQLFPNGVIPPSRTVPMGRAILNLFPLPQPGVVDPTGQRQYNTEYQFISDRERVDRILRLDFNFGSSTTSYLRLLQGFQNWEGFRGFLGSLSRWDQYSNFYKIPTRGAAFTLIHTLSPTLINETTIGINRAHQQVGATDKAAFAATNELSGLKDPVTNQVVNVPHIFQGANDLNLIPNINFSSSGAQSSGESLYGQDALNFGFNNRWPFQGTDQVASVINNMSWIKGTHNVKLGFYLERMARNVSVYAQYNTAGTYWFGTDNANPLDTGWPLSNALLGSVQSYGEDNRRQVNHARYTTVEWFVQDSWKVLPQLSIDLGLRFQLMQPTYSAGATLGMFEPSAYNVRSVGELLFPRCLDGSPDCRGNAAMQVAINPATGVTYPFPRRGFFDPASFGETPFSGVLQYKDKFFNTQGPLLSPRFGFAYDLFGGGSTAIRGGFGIFYDQPYSVDNIGAVGSGVGPMAAPPWFQAPRFYNTTFTNLRTAQPWFTSQRVHGGKRDFQIPTVYSWSFGIQQNVGAGIILDVAYVGNRGANRLTRNVTDLNALPPGTTWTPAGMTWSATAGPSGNGVVKPQFLDPTSGGRSFFSDDLIRALVGYKGWSDIDWWDNRGGDSNYHAMQIQVNRRFGRTAQFNFNYTWSRSLQYSPNMWLNNDRLTYNQDGSTRPHVANANFGWNVPGVRQFTANPVLNAIADGWRLSGVLAIYGGEPIGASCSVQSAPLGYPDGTVGTGLPFRCDQVGAALLPEGTPPPAGSGIDPRLYVPINEDAFQLPQPASLGFGNAVSDFGYGPGFFNLDMSIRKSFAISESTSLEFGMDSYNFLNHFNPSNPETRIRRRYTTNAQTRSGIGQITNEENDPRTMALSLRLRF